MFKYLTSPIKITFFLLIIYSLFLSCSKNNEIVETYFRKFEALAKSESWKEILLQGSIALKAAERANRPYDEAKICAQLASTVFYMGDFVKAQEFANRCHVLSEKIADSALFVRALYLESAVFRSLAPKNRDEKDSQEFYQRAVEIAHEAASIYSKRKLDDPNLQGKIYLNLGAAYADNPKGDLVKAKYYYEIALDCFRNVQATDDVIRTSLRLAKVYLLQRNHELSKKILNEFRTQISSERLTMHADYLEAQIKWKTHDKEGAIELANRGLTRALALGAKEDEFRLLSLLEAIKSN